MSHQGRGLGISIFDVSYYTKSTSTCVGVNLGMGLGMGVGFKAWNHDRLGVVYD